MATPHSKRNQARKVSPPLVMSKDQAARAAHILLKAVKEDAPTKLTKAYDLLAKMHGYENWNTLNAVVVNSDGRKTDKIIGESEVLDRVRHILSGRSIATIFSHGSVQNILDLFEAINVVIIETYRPSPDGLSWYKRSMDLLFMMIKIMVSHRDNQSIPLSLQQLEEGLTFTGMLNISYHLDNVPGELKMQMVDYLSSFSMPHSREQLNQHGYLTMYFMPKFYLLKKIEAEQNQSL